LVTLITGIDMKGRGCGETAAGATTVTRAAVAFKKFNG